MDSVFCLSFLIFMVGEHWNLSAEGSNKRWIKEPGRYPRGAPGSLDHWVLAVGEGDTAFRRAGLPMPLCDSLPSFQFRLVVKTALKLLLVFVEYSESNAPLLIQAVSAVDTKRGKQSLLRGHQGHSILDREASCLLASYWQHPLCVGISTKDLQRLL